MLRRIVRDGDPSLMIRRTRPIPHLLFLSVPLSISGSRCLRARTISSTLASCALSSTSSARPPLRAEALPGHKMHDVMSAFCKRPAIDRANDSCSDHEHAHEVNPSSQTSPVTAIMHTGVAFSTS